jgi:hypothetical protein
MIFRSKYRGPTNEDTVRDYWLGLLRERDGERERALGIVTRASGSRSRGSRARGSRICVTARSSSRSIVVESSISREPLGRGAARPWAQNSRGGVKRAQLVHCGLPGNMKSLAPMRAAPPAGIATKSVKDKSHVGELVCDRHR